MRGTVKPPPKLLQPTNTFGRIGSIRTSPPYLAVAPGMHKARRCGPGASPPTPPATQCYTATQTEANNFTRMWSSCRTAPSPPMEPTKNIQTNTANRNSTLRGVLPVKMSGFPLGLSLGFPSLHVLGFSKNYPKRPCLSVSLQVFRCKGQRTTLMLNSLQNLR